MSLGFLGPEERFYLARQFAYLGEGARAVTLLDDVVNGGFCCFTVLTRDPWLDSLRASSDFVNIVGHAETGYRESLSAFHSAGVQQSRRALSGDRPIRLETPATLPRRACQPTTIPWRTSSSQPSRSFPDHYEVEHSNPNHADVEICPICGRTRDYAGLKGNLVI